MPFKIIYTTSLRKKLVYTAQGLGAFALAIIFIFVGINQSHLLVLVNIIPLPVEISSILFIIIGILAFLGGMTILIDGYLTKIILDENSITFQSLRTKKIDWQRIQEIGFTYGEPGLTHIAIQYDQMRYHEFYIEPYGQNRREDIKETFSKISKDKQIKIMGTGFGHAVKGAPTERDKAEEPEKEMEILSEQESKEIVEKALQELNNLDIEKSTAELQRELTEIIEPLNSLGGEIKKWNDWFSRQTNLYSEGKMEEVSYRNMIKRHCDFLKEKLMV